MSKKRCLPWRVALEFRESLATTFSGDSASNAVSSIHKNHEKHVNTITTPKIQTFSRKFVQNFYSIKKYSIDCQNCPLSKNAHWTHNSHTHRHTNRLSKKKVLPRICRQNHFRRARNRPISRAGCPAALPARTAPTFGVEFSEKHRQTVTFRREPSDIEIFTAIFIFHTGMNVCLLAWACLGWVELSRSGWTKDTRVEREGEAGLCEEEKEKRQRLLSVSKRERERERERRGERELILL